METHDECALFCLWPLHPGPCASRRARNARTAPVGGGAGRARVGAPPRPAPASGRARVPVPGQPGRAPSTGRAQVPPPNRPASGRARVGGPPAPVPPPRKGAKKTAPRKAPPRKAAPQPDDRTQIRPPANDETQARPRQRSVASDGGGAALMMMGGIAGRDRAAETVMRDLRQAIAQDVRSGGGTANRDAAIERAANVVARTVAAHYGGGPEVRAKVVEAMTEAMKTGDISKVTALKRQLQGIHASAAQAAALHLFGLEAIVEQVEMWGHPMPALSSPASSFAHLDCNLSVFCRNPLHPGPCKGWKGTLAKVAPGTLKLIEEERKKKLAAKKAAKLKAQAQAKKIVDAAKRGEEVDEHPNAKKKLAQKATAQILGVEEPKVAEIEGKTKLTQKEMAWHANKKAAALLAANIAAGNLQSKAAQAKYRQTVRAEILAALKADNESGLTGPDSEYQKVINGWSQALSNGHADQHVKPQNEAGDALHTAVADAFHAAVLEDVKNAKVGHQGAKMKALTKALKAIPGEPGDPEHDAAVGEAVGHSVAPEELTDAPVVLPGAYTEEEANQLTAGVGAMLGITATSAASDEQIAQAMGVVKGKATAEGFKDNATAMIAKTAENQAKLAAAQQADGLDGFSPQGKKKFEKLLAAEFVAMMTTGEGVGEAGNGSLSDLIMQKKTGMITADEFHEQVQKKLKIKSKKQTAVQAPSAPAAGPAGGGAGAGGKTKAQESADVVSELDDLINDGPSGDSQALQVQAALNDPYESADGKLEQIKMAASVKATQLMDNIGGGLSDIEKQELHGIVAGMVEAAITDPKHVPGAKNMIKNLKKKSPSELKAFAKAILSPDQAEENAKNEAGLSDGPSAPSGGGSTHLSTAAPPQAAAQIASQAQAAYQKLLPDSDGSALATPDALAKLQQTIENGVPAEQAAASAAVALAKAFLKKKIGTSKMNPLHEAALQDALANEIHEGMVTGKFPDGGHLDKLGGEKFGFVKMKIAAKKEYDKTGGLPAGPLSKTVKPMPVTTSSKQQALDDALDDAFGPSTPAAPSGPPSTPSAGLQTSVGPMVPQHVPLVAQAIDKYQASMAAATTPEEKEAAVKALAGAFSAAKIFGALDELDISLGDMGGDSFMELSDKVTADFIDAINGDADAPGGLAAALPGIVAQIKKSADDAQKMNGFEEGSAALNSYKHALLDAMLEAELKKTSAPAVSKPGGGAGAGGTGTGVNPAVPAATAPTTPATPTPSTAPSVPAAAPIKVTPLAQAGEPPVLTGAKKVGKQGGYNPGGTYETPDGKKYYVKQQKTAKHARNEATAAALYREMGIPIPAVSIHSSSPVDDLTGTVTSTEIIPDAKPFDPKNPAHVAAVRRGFAVDAWLANWDAVGSSYNNVLVGPDGQVYRIDAGGALEFGGAGGPKGAKFGDTVGEIDTLRNPSINPAMAKVFGGMTDEEIMASMAQLEQITPDRIREIVKAQGSAPELAEKLIKRREDILKQLAELREAQKNKGPLGTPLTTGVANDIKKSLGGTKKKQAVFKPKGGYPISQVVLEGHENSVLEYNNKVEASRHSVDAASPPTPQMTAMPAGAPKTALKYYTSNAGYTAMNGHLRKNKGKKGTTGTAKSIADADQAFEQSRLSEPITTLRGVRGNADVFGALWTQRRDQNWTGAEFLDHGYSSSSVQMSTARGFAGAPGPNAVVMRVHMPAGTRAINLGKGSQYPGEAEILLNRGARFRIVADNGYQNGARHIDVEVICDGEGCADAV